MEDLKEGRREARCKANTRRYRRTDSESGDGKEEYS